jgi:hypothetical protein
MTFQDRYVIEHDRKQPTSRNHKALARKSRLGRWPNIDSQEAFVATFLQAFSGSRWRFNPSGSFAHSAP